jgi:hypothetical protein
MAGRTKRQLEYIGKSKTRNPQTELKAKCVAEPLVGGYSVIRPSPIGIRNGLAGIHAGENEGLTRNNRKYSETQSS